MVFALHSPENTLLYGYISQDLSGYIASESLPQENSCSKERLICEGTGGNNRHCNMWMYSCLRRDPPYFSLSSGEG